MNMENICNMDCENKKSVSNNPTSLALCNNCIHVKKQDYYLPRKAMDQLYKESNIFGKATIKIIDFLIKGSG